MRRILRTPIVTSQGLQIVSSEDSFAGLGIVTDRIVIVNIVFRVYIAGRGRNPMSIQGGTHFFFGYLFLGHMFGIHADATRGMKPGLPVFTTLLSLCLI